MKFVTRLALTAMLVTSGLSAPVRAAEPDPLLPKDTTAVIYVNFRQVLESDMVKKYAIEQFKQGLEGEEAQKVLKGLGLDPLKDIDRLIVGMWGVHVAMLLLLGVLLGRRYGLFRRLLRRRAITPSVGAQPGAQP